MIGGSTVLMAYHMANDVRPEGGMAVYRHHLAPVTDAEARVAAAYLLERFHGLGLSPVRQSTHIEAEMGATLTFRFAPDAMTPLTALAAELESTYGYDSENAVPVAKIDTVVAAGIAAKLQP